MCHLVFVGARFVRAPGGEQSFRGARHGDCKGRRTRWDSVAILGFMNPTGWQGFMNPGIVITGGSLGIHGIQ